VTDPDKTEYVLPELRRYCGLSVCISLNTLKIYKTLLLKFILYKGMRLSVTCLHIFPVNRFFGNCNYFIEPIVLRWMPPAGSPQYEIYLTVAADVASRYNYR